MTHLLKDIADGDPRVEKALKLLVRFGGIDGEHHKTWCIDQAVRILSGRKYKVLVAAACEGEDGPDTYGWDEGTPP